MITHVVLFKLKDRSPENIERTRKKLETLRGNVPQIRQMEIGVDVLKSERSFDISLIVKFDTLSDLDAYQKHPFHAGVVDYIAKVRESTVVVDYES